MNIKQRLVHGTMLAVAVGNATLPGLNIVTSANAQQAVNVTAMPSLPAGTNAVGTVTVNGTVSVSNTNANGQASSANSSPVVLSNDQTTADPCTFQNKNFTSFSGTTLGTTQFLAGLSGKKIYACSLAVVASTATNFSITEGSNATCSTTSAVVFGNSGTVPANGLPFSANGGLTFGNGAATIFKSANSTNGLCVLNAATSLVVLTLGYIQQ